MISTTLKTWTTARKTMCPTHNSVSAAGETRAQVKDLASHKWLLCDVMGCDRTVDGTETMPSPPPVLGAEVHSPCPDSSELIWWHEKDNVQHVLIKGVGTQRSSFAGFSFHKGVFWKTYSVKFERPWGLVLAAISNNWSDSVLSSLKSQGVQMCHFLLLDKVENKTKTKK